MAEDTKPETKPAETKPAEPKATTKEAPPEEVVIPDGYPSESWTKAELVAWCETHGVIVDPEGTKADIMAGIENVYGPMPDEDFNPFAIEGTAENDHLPPVQEVPLEPTAGTLNPPPAETPAAAKEG